jgi:hypothetical protein
MWNAAHAPLLPSVVRRSELEVWSEAAKRERQTLQPADPDEAMTWLHLSKWLVCMPSFRRSAIRESHDPGVAQEVTEGLSRLALTAIEFDACTAAARGKNRELRSEANLIGAIGELGALGAMWWGIRNGLRPPESYIHPTPTYFDHSDSGVGERTGHDIRLFNGNGKAIKLQVKAMSLEQIERKRGREERPYRKDIVLVELDQIMSMKSARAAKTLLGAVANEDVSTLTMVNHEIQKNIDTVPVKSGDVKGLLSSVFDWITPGLAHS